MQQKSSQRKQKGLDEVHKEDYNIHIDNRKRGENMSEKDKKILETIAEALPKMSDFDKGYFLGTAESKAAEKRTKKSKDEPLNDETS